MSFNDNIDEGRIFALLQQGQSLDQIQTATGASALEIQTVAQTYQVSTLNQRVFDLLSVGLSPDSVAALTGLPANQIQAIGASTSYTQSTGFGPSSAGATSITELGG